MPSGLKAYTVPIFLFVLAMFFQLFLLPRSFPPSHYDGTQFSKLAFSLDYVLCYTITFRF